LANIFPSDRDSDASGSHTTALLCTCPVPVLQQRKASRVEAHAKQLTFHAIAVAVEPGCLRLCSATKQLLRNKPIALGQPSEPRQRHGHCGPEELGHFVESGLRYEHVARGIAPTAFFAEEAKPDAPGEAWVVVDAVKYPRQPRSHKSAHVSSISSQSCCPQYITLAFLALWNKETNKTAT
jgi:hypothetical protein